MSKEAATTMLVASPAVSAFVAPTEPRKFYLYQDYIGFVLECSQGVVEMIDFCREPTSKEAIIAHFAEQFEGEDHASGVLWALRQHRMVLQQDEDPLAGAADFYPLRAFWSVAYDDGQDLWLVMPEGDRGEPRPVKLGPWQRALWEGLNGKVTVEDLGEDVGDEYAEAIGGDDPARTAMEWVLGLVDSRRQLAKLAETAVADGEMPTQPTYLRSAMPHPRWWPGEPLPKAAPAQDLSDYHQTGIDDSQRQFEDKETTLAHAFSDPHPALKGEAFGRRLAKAIAGTTTLAANAEYVEVGAGLGDVARQVIEVAIEEGRPPARYTIVDLAPELIAEQKKLLADVGVELRWFETDAQTLPLPDKSVDLLLANEVVGDLPTEYLRRDEEKTGTGEAWERLRQYSIKLIDPPERFGFNLGAIKLIEEAHRVLKPGGCLVLTEYGDLFAYPIPADHLDHEEHAIQFTHLRRVANHLGFNTDIQELLEFLDADTEMDVLASTRSYFSALRALFAKYDVALRKRPYTREMLAELVGDKLDLDRIQSLRMAPLSERVLGLYPDQFYALVARKPFERPPIEFE